METERIPRAWWEANRGWRANLAAVALVIVAHFFVPWFLLWGLIIWGLITKPAWLFPGTKHDWIWHLKVSALLFAGPVLLTVSLFLGVVIVVLTEGDEPERLSKYQDLVREMPLSEIQQIKGMPSQWTWDIGDRTLPLGAAGPVPYTATIPSPYPLWETIELTVVDDLPTSLARDQFPPAPNPGAKLSELHLRTGPISMEEARQIRTHLLEAYPSPSWGGTALDTDWPSLDLWDIPMNMAGPRVIWFCRETDPVGTDKRWIGTLNLTELTMDELMD